MAIKVGLIDYYLDEWHANNYPQFFRDWAPQLEAAYAWAKIDSPLPGGMTSREWEKKTGVAVLDTMEEVIERSDVLIVLSPDNPEMHEELCALPLKSGKRTYIDKTFAETKESAERIFAMAKEGNTPCYSTSALFFAKEYQPIYEKEPIVIDSCGPGLFPIYSIHQLEPIVAMFKGAKPVRAMSIGDREHPMAVIEFEGGKRAKIATFEPGGCFLMHVSCADKSFETVQAGWDFWAGFTRELAVFFETGKIPVPHENTLSVITAREIAIKALDKPFEWIYA